MGNLFSVTVRNIYSPVMSFYTSSHIYLQRKIHTEKWKMEIYRLKYTVIVSAVHILYRFIAKNGIVYKNVHTFTISQSY